MKTFENKVLPSEFDIEIDRDLLNDTDIMLLREVVESVKRPIDKVGWQHLSILLGLRGCFTG